MATNAPKGRKTHVTRIFGTNDDGDILSDMWADVERIDESQHRDTESGIRQKLKRKLRWRDDPSDPAEYLDPDIEDQLPPDTLSRKTVLVKVCDPNEEDLNKPLEWIPIRAIKRIKSKNNSKKNNTMQQQYEK